MKSARRLALAAGLIVLVLALLAACGKSSQTTPAPTRQPNPQPTEPPGATLGQLTGQMRQAWSGLHSYRAVFTTSQNLVAMEALFPGLAKQLPPPATGTPLTGKSLVTLQVTDEVMLPDRKDRLILINNQPVLELMAVGDRMYRRSYTSAVGGLPVPGAWSAIDSSHLAANDPMTSLIADFKTVGNPPGTGDNAPEQALLLHPGSTIQVGSRLCRQYQVVTTTQTGEKVEVGISVGADQLPCAIVTTAGGTRSETDYSGYNEPMSLPVPPATPIASPVASPAASPASGPATPVALGAARQI